MARTVLLTLLLQLGLLAACGTPAPRPVALRWAARSASTRISSTASPGGVVRLTVDDTAGIGGAQISIQPPEMPRRLLVAFRLRGLERLRLAYGDTLVVASVSSAGDGAVQQWVTLPRDPPASELAIDPSSQYWMPIRLLPDEGLIEVEMPPHVYAGQHRTLDLEWIDFYR